MYKYTIKACLFSWLLPSLVWVWSAAGFSHALGGDWCGILHWASLRCVRYLYGLFGVLECNLWGANVLTEDASRLSLLYLFAGRWCLWWQVATLYKTSAASGHCCCSYQRHVRQATASWPTLALKSPRLISCRDAPQDTAELWVKPVFFCRFSLISWGIHTEKRGIFLIPQREVHGHDALRSVSVVFVKHSSDVPTCQLQCFCTLTGGCIPSFLCYISTALKLYLSVENKFLSSFEL